VNKCLNFREKHTKEYLGKSFFYFLALKKKTFTRKPNFLIKVQLLRTFLLGLSLEICLSLKLYMAGILLFYAVQKIKRTLSLTVC